MTHKISLALALFAAASMAACSVDAPERESFDYSFQEALPAETADTTDSLGFGSKAYDGRIDVRFGDGTYEHGEIHPNLRSVELTIASVWVREVSTSKWHQLFDKPRVLDLLSVAAGETVRIGGAPLPRGEYDRVVLELAGASLLDDTGIERELALPGSVLKVASDFTLGEDPTELTVRLGAVGTIDFDEGSKTWTADPDVSVQYDEHHG